MATLRRNQALSPDGPTARFLYAIIKQLDLKTVDWNVVATSQGITNGHAARMRYSRFRQQIEGVTTQSRVPKARGKKEKAKEKEGKEGKEEVKKGKKKGFEGDGDDEAETSPRVKRQNITPSVAGLRVKQEHCPQIKNEQDVDAGSGGIKIKRETSPHQDVPAAAPPPPQTPPAVRIKTEPNDNDVNMGSPGPDPDIWHILPPATGNEVVLLSRTDKTRKSTQISDSPFAIRPSSSPHPSHHLRPLSSLSTVSLADLEVSPRSRPAAAAASRTSADRGGGGGGSGVASCHSFAREMGAVGPAAGPVLDASAAAGTTTTHIKAEEPGSDVEWIDSRPSAKTTVKSEPAEI